MDKQDLFYSRCPISHWGKRSKMQTRHGKEMKWLNGECLVDIENHSKCKTENRATSQSKCHIFTTSSLHKLAEEL